jgi:hypothetical protein
VHSWASTLRRGLAAQLRQRIRDERQRKLSDLLATVRCRLDAGDAAAALELLGKITLRELESGERESVETLRTNAKALLETRELEASYERLLQAFDPLAAREVAERLLARASESERAGRQGQIAAAMEAARRLFGVWASQVGDDAAEEHETSHSVEMGAPLNITEGRGAPVPLARCSGTVARPAGMLQPLDLHPAGRSRGSGASGPAR